MTIWGNIVHSSEVLIDGQDKHVAFCSVGRGLLGGGGGG